MKTWDIFCRVIDNFGDIGVCWRLAKQLTAEHDCKVRLWVDELQALQMILPSAQIVNQQRLEQVEVRQWPAEFSQHETCADIVIEAFACDIPPAYISLMVEQHQSKQAPIWINLEYLSAEPWVEGCHKMPSIHPSTGLTKTFFFPGFTLKTGGLIRETNAITHRLSLTDSQRITADVLSPNRLRISLFAYENAALNTLLEGWKKSSCPIECIIPQGKIMQSVNSYLEFPLLVDQPHTLGALTLKAIPFLSQRDYDQLLQTCDMNFVRGEDSLVRAIWAGKPFVWQAYQQEDDTHLTKVDSVLALYTEKMAAPLASAVAYFWRGWNQQTNMTTLWSNLFPYLNTWTSSTLWQQQLANQPDLATALVTFSHTNTSKISLPIKD